MDPLVQSTTQVRYGRTRISNAYGSGLAPLSLPIVFEYWNGQVYITNGDDDLSSPTFGLLNYQGNLQAGETVMTASAIAAGMGNINLSAPGFGNEGSVDVSIISPSYLPKIANGRATFGIQGGKHNFIYRGRRGR
jgi:MSHA biogenesis protein MshQ